MSDDIDLEAIEKAIADLNAAGPAGPRTTFPRNPDDSPGNHAEVTILCKRENWDNVVRWLHAMTHGTPALIARIRELEARRDIDSEIIDDLRLRHTQAVTARDAYAEQLLGATKHAVELERKIAELKGKED